MTSAPAASGQPSPRSAGQVERRPVGPEHARTCRPAARGGLGVPATAWYLDEHAGSVVWPRPTRHATDRTDHDSHDRPVGVLHGGVAARSQKSEHRLVADQHLGLEVGHAARRRGLEKAIEQIRPQPSAPPLGHGHGEFPVAVGQEDVVGFTDDLAAFGTCLVEHGDQTETTVFGGVRHLLEERARRPVCTEETALAVLQVEAVIQPGKSVDVCGLDPANRQRRIVGEPDFTGREIGVGSIG